MKTNDRHSLVKQGTILAVTVIVVRFIGFLYRIPLLGMIKDEGMGYYSAAFSIYNLFFIISSYGIPIALSKMISERLEIGEYYNAHKVFKIALLFCLSLGLISSSILWFGGEILSKLIETPGAIYSLRALAPTITIVAVMSALRGYFQGMGTMKPTAVSQIIEQIFNAIFSVAMAWILLDKGIEYAAAGGTMGTGIGAFFGLIFLLFLYILINKKFKFKIRGDYKNYIKESNGIIFKRLIFTLIPIIAATAVFNIVNIIDLYMLKSGLAYLGYTQLEADKLYGIFSGKYVLLTTLPISIATALATASVPSISASIIKGDKEKVRDKINTAMKITVFSTLPSAVGLFVLAFPILQLLFPNSPAGGELLQVGAAAVIFYSISYIATGVLQGINKILIPAKNAFYGAIVKIILNFIFIYLLNLNVYGPVISTDIFSLIVAVLNIRAVIKYSKVKIDFVKTIIKPLIGSLIMGIYCYVFYKIIIWGTGSNTIACLISILFSIIIYFAVILSIKGLTTDEIKMLPMGNKIIKKLKL